MSKTIAVLISDIHFTINTLEEAAASLLRAQFKAKILGVPLIIAGDLLDAKAIMRAECVNRIIELVSVKDAPEMIFIVGNHDKINEKSEAHSLNFLKPYATVIERPQVGSIGGVECMMIPYQHDKHVIKNILDDKDNPPPQLLIMHQGVLDSKAGHYIQDKSACPSEWFANYRVISGHYHERQDIKCGRPQKGCVGLWSYLGNPYSLNFAEANMDKGYSILNDDGTLEFVYLDLRQHVALDITTTDLIEIAQRVKKRPMTFKKSDVVRVRVTGSKEDFSTLDKKTVASLLDLEQDFKLDLIPLDIKSSPDVKSTSTQPEILDNLISTLTNVSDEQKKRLKTLWKDLCDEDTIVPSP